MLSSKFPPFLGALTLLALLLTSARAEESVSLHNSTGAPVVVAEDHTQILSSSDPVLAKNKRLLYDFWRIVLEAGHVDQIDRFVAEDFIQHNPNMASGRDFFARLIKTERPVPLPIEEKLKSPLVLMAVEKDIVVMIFRDEGVFPNNPEKTYTTTRHDTYRIEDGKVAEHWDAEVGGMSRHDALIEKSERN